MNYPEKKRKGRPTEIQELKEEKYNYTEFLLNFAEMLKNIPYEKMQPEEKQSMIINWLETNFPIYKFEE